MSLFTDVLSVTLFLVVWFLLLFAVVLVVFVVDGGVVCKITDAGLKPRTAVIENDMNKIDGSREKIFNQESYTIK